MAKISAKNAVITLDDSAGSPQDISAAVRSFEIKQDAGKVEVTGFTEGSANFIPGLPVHEVTLDILYENTASTGVWAVLKGIYMHATSKSLTIKPDTAGETLRLEVMLDALPLKGEPAGALEVGSVTFSVMGAAGAAWS